MSLVDGAGSWTFAASRCSDMRVFSLRFCQVDELSGFEMYAGRCGTTASAEMGR